MQTVLLIDSLRQGGAERSSIEMATRLLDHGIRTTLVTLRSDHDLMLPPEVPHLVAGQGLAGIRTLRKMLRTGRYALLHTVLTSSNRVGQLAALGSEVPVLTSLVNTTYSPEHYRTVPYPARMRVHQGVDLAMRNLTDHYHAISAVVRDAAARYRRIPPERITVVPRGRDRSWLDVRTGSSRLAARQALGLRDDDIVLLNVGRHEPQKAQADLLAALPEVRRATGARVHLLIVGRQGAMTGRLEHLAAETGGVSLIGFRSDVRPYYAAADVFVFPSRYEGLGGAVIEAMAAGLPVVASDAPALLEATGGHGFHHAAGDVTALIEAIVAAITDGPAAERAAASARARFESLFTLEAVTAAMADLYRAVAAGDPCLR